MKTVLHKFNQFIDNILIHYSIFNTLKYCYFNYRK